MASPQNIAALEPSSLAPVAAASGDSLYDSGLILKRFLSEIAYTPPKINATNERLENAMENELDARNMPRDQLETIHAAASLIEVAYHHCSYAEKENLAMLNWYLLCVDDTLARDPGAFYQFEQRFLRREPQLHPVLDALAAVIMRIWDHYNFPSANSIIISLLDFITFACVEAELGTTPLLQVKKRFPWFARERNGAATAYTLMPFTKSSNLDITGFIQAVPDINFFICAANDLLSFHKEELVGEKSNYVHNRANAENKAPLQVLAEIAEELRVSVRTVDAYLAHDPNALRTWKTLQNGYIAWHLAQDRYQLKDLGL